MSGCESQPAGIRIDNNGGCDASKCEAQDCGQSLRDRPALFKWAHSFVTNVTGRTATLVRRVLHTGDTTPLIAPVNEFEEAVQGKETWTQTVTNAETVNSVDIEGLDDPVWRQTTIVESGKLIESTPLPSDVSIPVPDGPSDIKTTVWYGRTDTTPKQPRACRNLIKGMRAAAAVLLLEAMVLLSAGAHWSGAWTQRVYGTSQADVWEIFGRDNLTNVSWKQ